MSQEILIATHNQHKKEEIQQILGNDFSVTSLADYDLHDEIVEDGNTESFADVFKVSEWVILFVGIVLFAVFYYLFTRKYRVHYSEI